MREHDEFIKRFKKIEQRIRERYGDGKNFKWLEDQISDEDVKGKMRLCRTLRNFIQHEADYENFVSISNGMMTFLDDLYRSVAQGSSSVTVNDLSTCIKMSDTIGAAIKKLNSYGNVLPIVEDYQAFGKISVNEVFQALANGKTLESKISSLGSFSSVKRIDYCEEPANEMCVVSDASGYIVGWI